MLWQVTIEVGIQMMSLVPVDGVATMVAMIN